MLLCGIYSKLKNKHNKWWGLNAYFLIPSVVIGGCTRGSSNPGLELSLQSWVDDDYDNNLVENHQCWCLPQRGSQPIWSLSFCFEEIFFSKRFILKRFHLKRFLSKRFLLKSCFETLKSLWLHCVCHAPAGWCIIDDDSIEILYDMYQL